MLVAIFQVLTAALLEIQVFCGVTLCHCHKMTLHNITEDLMPSITLQNTVWCFKKFVFSSSKRFDGFILACRLLTIKYPTLSK